MLSKLMYYLGMGGEVECETPEPPLPESLRTCDKSDTETGEISGSSDNVHRVLEVPKHYNRMNHFDEYVKRNKGNKYPDFTSKEIETIRGDFEKFVNVYYELSPFDIEGSTHTSFLGMDYVICKLCDKNGIPIKNRESITKCFQNLRKMSYHESITKRVFGELGWVFVPWNFGVE